MSGIDRLIENYPEISLDSGLTVFSQGQPCEHYIVLTSGSVRVFARSEDGKELVLYRMQPGDICILTTACLMGENHYPAEAITESAVCARLLPHPDFNRLLEQQPDFRQFVFNNFGQRMTDLMLQLESIAFSNIEQRLKQFLDKHADTQQQIHITHQQIAVEIGSAREVISRQLKRLEQQGSVKLHRGYIQLI